MSAVLPPPNQNPPHCLEVTPPSSEKLVSVMRLSDLSTEDDNSGHCKMNRYDKKIDSLMNAVGCLKSEVRVWGAEAASAVRVRGAAQVQRGGGPFWLPPPGPPAPLSRLPRMSDAPGEAVRATWCPSALNSEPVAGQALCTDGLF